jgi:lipoate-protein ligase B
VAIALEISWLGSLPYAEALERQWAAIEERRAGGPDRLLLLEHPAVITLGRSAKPENVRSSREDLAARGVEIHEVARGGDVTYHGPGQLVGYLIVDLQARGAADVHAWLRGIEAGVGDAIAELGVAWRREEGMTGVFVDDPGQPVPPRKIASIGVGLRDWITYHGFALNATIDPVAFADIVPCGLHGVEMTSLAQELRVAGDAQLFDECRRQVERAFERRLQ